LIAFTFFSAIFRILDPLSILLDRSITLFGNPNIHETIKGFFVKVAKFVVVCLGIAAVFQEWGFNVAAVLVSLRLVGMAVALGAQNFIKNMFAGLTIFWDRVFVRRPIKSGIFFRPSQPIFTSAETSKPIRNTPKHSSFWIHLAARVSILSSTVLQKLPCGGSGWP
jgi:hypothetical protein